MRIAFALALGLSLVAAPTQEAKPEQKAPPTLAQMMPKPGPEMKKLQAMIGSWTIEETMETSFMGPGGKGTGVSHVTPGPGGLSILINYHSTDGHMKGFRGHGVVAWDADAKAYKQSWADNMAPMLVLSTGVWEGDNLVMTSAGTMMGKPFKGRDTLSGIGTDTVTLVSEMAIGDSPLTKVMTLVHTRSKVPAKAAEKKEEAKK